MEKTNVGREEMRDGMRWVGAGMEEQAEKW
jgi:hypothetical protein